MNRSKIATRFTNARHRVNQLAVGALALAPAAAFAQGADLVGAVTAEVDTAQLIGIGLVVMTVAGIIMFVNSGKRVAR